MATNDQESAINPKTKSISKISQETKLRLVNFKFQNGFGTYDEALSRLLDIAEQEAQPKEITEK